ncbi:hypothetical protein D3C80_1659250 [compost metagenome]
MFGIGVKQVGLGIQIIRQMIVTACQIFLQRANRKYQMANQRQEVVPQGANDQQYRLLIPGVIH